MAIVEDDLLDKLMVSYYLRLNLKENDINVYLEEKFKKVPYLDSTKHVEYSISSSRYTQFVPKNV